MNLRPILTLLFLNCSMLAFAQTSESSITQAHKNDLGFNTTIILPGIFVSNGSSPLNLIYKRYTAENRALRLGLSGYFNSNTNDNSSSPNYSNGSNLNISLTVGKEFQKPINNLKWTWYYGGDLLPYYSNYSNSNFLDGIKSYTSETTNFGLTLRPFLGIRYNINTRLYIAAEASFQVSYGSAKNFAKNLATDFVQVDTRGHSIASSFNAANGIFLFYRF